MFSLSKYFQGRFKKKDKSIGRREGKREKIGRGRSGEKKNLESKIKKVLGFHLFAKRQDLIDRHQKGMGIASVCLVLGWGDGGDGIIFS